MVFFTLSVLDMTGGVENQVVIFSIIMKKTNKTKLTFKKMFVLIFGANSLIASIKELQTGLTRLQFSIGEEELIGRMIQYYIRPLDH